ncbi:unnamed protein product [Choristocarpus tenellus]
MVCTCTPPRTPPSPPWAQNNCCIAKVMFLAAVACPKKLSKGVWFNGKIGICPIMDTEVTQHSSEHRPKHAKELVPVTVNRERCKKHMIKDVFPVIKACVPSPEGKTIFVWQDRVSPHTKGGGSWRQLRRWRGMTL